MIVQETIRHQAAIVGRVIDARTGGPLAGVLVDLTGGPEPFLEQLAMASVRYGSAWPAMLARANRTVSRADGAFVFADLPDGQYSVTAALPAGGSRYGTASASAQVARGGDGRIAVAHLDLVLSATIVTGRINTAEGGAIMMAAVFVEGSGERVRSDGQGRYTLVGVEAGQRVLVASAQGFQTVRTPAVIDAAGSTCTIDITLSPNGGA